MLATGLSDQPDIIKFYIRVMFLGSMEDFGAFPHTKAERSIDRVLRVAGNWSGKAGCRYLLIRGWVLKTSLLPDTSCRIVIKDYVP